MEKKTRQGKIRIVLGTVLLLLQGFSIWGNYVARTLYVPIPTSTAQLAFDLIFLISSNFIGIIGLILLISGLIAFFRK